MTCSLVSKCSITSQEKILNSFTCPLFDAVPAPVYEARIRLLDMYGPDVAVDAIRKQTLEEDK